MGRNNLTGLFTLAGVIAAVIIVSQLSKVNPHVVPPIGLSIGGALSTGAFLWLYPTWRNLRRFRSLPLYKVDSMSEHAFVHYVASLLTFNGFETVAPPGAKTLGDGLIAKKRGGRTAVCCVRSTGNVSQAAIRQAIEYMQRYECSTSMIVTNSYFTPPAIALSRSMGCELVDRTRLAEWIAEFDKYYTSNARQARPQI